MIPLYLNPRLYLVNFFAFVSLSNSCSSELFGLNSDHLQPSLAFIKPDTRSRSPAIRSNHLNSLRLKS